MISLQFVQMFLLLILSNYKITFDKRELPCGERFRYDGHFPNVAYVFEIMVLIQPSHLQSGYPAPPILSHDELAVCLLSFTRFLAGHLLRALGYPHGALLLQTLCCFCYNIIVCLATDQRKYCSNIPGKSCSRCLA
jgi:hypothetical protein